MEQCVPDLAQTAVYGGKMYGDEKILQVVGHTPVEKIYREGNVISCDVFSTYRDGRAIGTEEFAVVDTESWEYGGVENKIQGLFELL